MIVAPRMDAASSTEPVSSKRGTSPAATPAGSGGATKQQVQFMLTRLLRLKSVPSPSDAADGVAAALTYLMTSRVPKLAVVRPLAASPFSAKPVVTGTRR